MEYGITKIYQREKQCEREDYSAQHHSQPQRLVTEAENRVHGIFEKLGKGLFGFAGSSSGALVIYDRRREADPCAQSGKIAVSFRKIDDSVGCLTVQKTEDPCVERNGKVRDQAHDFVKQGKQFAPKSCVRAAGTLRDDYLRAVLPSLDHARQNFRRILEIA